MPNPENSALPGSICTKFDYGDGYCNLLVGGIQALNHKDVNGALEHPRLIQQELGISRNSTKFKVNYTHVHL
jgi:hypothetical protein